jgi:hypothetical protein
VDNHHFEKRIGRREEFSHDDFQEGLALEILLFGTKFDVELANQSHDLLLPVGLDSVEDLEDRVKDKLVESTLKAAFAALGPFLSLWVEVVVALTLKLAHTSQFLLKEDWTYPKSLHHLRLVDTKFLRISDSELSDSEGPPVQTRTEGNGALIWVDLDVTKGLVKVRGDNDVDGFDGSGERLIEILLSNLKLEQSTINLVDDDDRLDTLAKGLSEHRFGLDTDTFNAVNDDKSAISHSKSSSDLGGEIDVTG